MEKRTQAERSEQREQDLLKQQQAIAESRKAARHKKPEATEVDEKEIAALKLRKIILQCFLAFLILGILYAVFSAMSGSRNAPATKPNTEETAPTDK